MICVSLKAGSKNPGETIQGGVIEGGKKFDLKGGRLSRKGSAENCNWAGGVITLLDRKVAEHHPVGGGVK